LVYKTQGIKTHGKTVKLAFWISLFMIIMYTGIIYSLCASHVVSEAGFTAQVTIIHY